MEVYTIKEDDLERVPVSDIDYEENLEEHLLKAAGAEIGGIELLYVSRQDTLDAGGKFDILGLDENGDTVIVELKRGKAPRGVITQALEYGSEIRTESYGDLDDRYDRYLAQSQGTTSQTDSLREAHAEFFEREEDPLSEREFNTRQRLLIVGTEFRDVTLNIADLLRDHDLDVVCVEYRAFHSETENLEILTTENIRRPLDEAPTTSAGDESLTDTKRAQLEFWEEVVEEIGERSGTSLVMTEPKPQNYLQQRRLLPSSHYYTFSVNTLKGKLSVKLAITENAEQIFEYLKDHRSEIESEFPEALEWNPLPENNRATILVERDGNIKTDRAQWEEYREWLIERGEKFDAVFGPYFDDFYD